MLQSPFFRILLLFLVSIGILHALGTQLSWYWHFWWLDIVVHFLGGFFIGGFIIWLLFRGLNWREYVTQKTKIFFTALFAALIVGGLWEVFEIFIGATSPSYSYFMSDTFSDFGADIAGALSAFIIFFWLKERGIARGYTRA